MLSGISTIYFSTDLVYPDAATFAIKKDQIRELYHKLTEAGGYPYENLDLQASNPTLSTRRDTGVSQCLIGSGRIRIEESSPAVLGMTAEEFTGVVKTVLSRLPGSAPPIISQRCVIRCTATPTLCEDSLDLLAGNVANVLDKIVPFGRPPSFFGVRFRFSPGQEAENNPDEDAAASEKPEENIVAEGANAPKKKKKRKKDPIVHRGFLNLRFETYSQDIKKVWMEVDARYVEEIFEISDFAKIEANIRETSAFLTDNAKSFLEQFDLKSDDDNAEKG